MTSPPGRAAAPGRAGHAASHDWRQHNKLHLAFDDEHGRRPMASQPTARSGNGRGCPAKASVRRGRGGDSQAQAFEEARCKERGSERSHAGAVSERPAFRVCSERRPPRHQHRLSRAACGSQKPVDLPCARPAQSRRVRAADGQGRAALQAEQLVQQRAPDQLGVQTREEGDAGDSDPILEAAQHAGRTHGGSQGLEVRHLAGPLLAKRAV